MELSRQIPIGTKSGSTIQQCVERSTLYNHQIMLFDEPISAHRPWERVKEVLDVMREFADTVGDHALIKPV